MQGGKQDANKTKGDGKTNPCRRMDVQKSRRFTQKLHTSDKTGKSHNTFSQRQGLKQKNRKFHQKTGGA